MEDKNKIDYILKVCSKQEPKSTSDQSWHKVTEEYQAVIMHAGRTTQYHYFIIICSLQPATDNYPLALLPIANKPLLSYQIEYLERNGIH